MEVILLFLGMTSLVSLSSSTFISVCSKLTLGSVEGVFFKPRKWCDTATLVRVPGTECEVNFEFMDYKVMTRRCKGPAFPAKEFCSAFKEFACPYVHQINDMTTDRAHTMFSYMNVYGNYPPGLFANECKETKRGLVCPKPPLSSPNLNASTADSTVVPFNLLLISVLALRVLA